MATTASTIWPNQQQPMQQQQLPEQSVPYPEAVPNSAWHSSSGSIGPFFAVISVLTVLAILSCIVGRFCRNRKPPTPLDSIKERNCFGWLKGKLCWKCMDCGDQCLGNKANMAGQKRSTNIEGKGQEVV